ncbi:MAG: mechanosensitive ion channel family protein [Steroidobacteraceae bacterium]
MEQILSWLKRTIEAINSAAIQIGDSRFSLANIVILVLILVGSWLAARWLERAIQRLLRSRADVGSSTGYAIGRLLRYFVWMFGSIIGLQLVGFDLSSLALIGGALGVGIGFGLQNIVSNFVSGIVLLVERTIKVGDFVDLESGVRGTVTEIGVRYTRVTTNSAVDVIVPNSEFTSRRVVNWTLDNRYRRLNIPFSVAYGSDKNLVREAAMAAAAAVPFTISDERRHSSVWFTKFGDSSLEFDLVVWVGRDAVSRPGSTISRYLWALDDALHERGIEIPFPQRDLHVRSGRLAVTIEQAANSSGDEWPP